MDLASPGSLGTGKGRWLLNLALSLAVGGSAAAYAWSLCPKPTVTVQTLIRVPPMRPWAGRNAARPPDLEHHQQQQVSLVKSRPRLIAFLRDPLVADLPIITEQPDPVAWLESNLQADFRVAPEVLRIALSGDKPDELALLLNELREAYLRETARREAKPLIQRLSHLETMRDFALPEESRKRIASEMAALEVALQAPRPSRVPEPSVVAHRTPNTLRATVAALTGLACALLCFGFLSPSPVLTPDRLRSFVGGAFSKRARA